MYDFFFIISGPGLKIIFLPSQNTSLILLSGLLLGDAFNSLLLPSDDEPKSGTVNLE